ncbi:MBL fold metallo-hydrolase [Candidatus Microgenomates bacterium]|nr:MBL fold metallo-hydrolase [Candidatus Microgenomates bacterium]
MKIRRLVVGQLATNCYLAVCSETNKGIIIDPGDSADFISEKILELKIKPKFIVLTHGHFDHLIAAEELRLNFKIPILIHKEDLFLAKKAYQSASYFLGTKEEFLILKKVNFVKAGQKIKFGQEELEVIHTPGHTPGSISLYSGKRNILFSGDLVFENGVGRTDFSYSSEEELQNSLKRIFSLPSKTLVYPGHGEELVLEETIRFYSLDKT